MLCPGGRWAGDSKVNRGAATPDGGAVSVGLFSGTMTIGDKVTLTS